MRLYSWPPTADPPSFVLPALTLPGAEMARNLATFGRPVCPALPDAQNGVPAQVFEFARGLRWELLPAPFDRVEALAPSPSRPRP